MKKGDKGRERDSWGGKRKCRGLISTVHWKTNDMAAFPLIKRRSPVQSKLEWWGIFGSYN